MMLIAAETHGGWFSLDHLAWFLRITAQVTVQNGASYLAFAVVSWLTFYVVWRSRWLGRKIIERMPPVEDFRREIWRSVFSLTIFAAVAAETWLWCVAVTGQTPVYYRLDDYAINYAGLGSDGGWTWFALSIVAMIFIHDAYFYWTHRLMHHPRLFRATHLVHHKSTNPTPFAAYSFSAAEAFVQAGIFPLVTLLLPVNIAAVGIFMLWQISFNVAGHCGYEFFPRSFLDTRWGKFLNTPTHHIMHHRHVRTNFGLYFNVWDRLLGTNDAKYEARFLEVTSRGMAAGLGSMVELPDEQEREAA